MAQEFIDLMETSFCEDIDFHAIKQGTVDFFPGKRGGYYYKFWYVPPSNWEGRNLFLPFIYRTYRVVLDRYSFYDYL